MMISLEEFIGDSVNQLPVSENKVAILNPETCAQPPAEMHTNFLKMAVSYHDYDDAIRYDVVDFCADKCTYRALGLLVFSAVFHSNSRITLNLHHAETVIKQLIIESQVSKPSDPYPRELVTIPAAYGYSPKVLTGPHPLACGNSWRRDVPCGSCLPSIKLTNKYGVCVTDEQRRVRDIVTGFGGPAGSAAVGALLLDIGLPDTVGTEFVLEGPPGYQSIVPASAEARFWISTVKSRSLPQSTIESGK